VKHKRLARPAYATLGSREAAEALGHRTLAALERGEMPDWLKEPVRRECDTIADLIRAYRGIIAVPSSTQEVLDAIIAEVGTVNLSEVSVLWAEGWIHSLKQERHLAPGTIRKRKGALSRVFHWAVDHRPLCLTNNPLDRLPHGYSGYTEYDVAVLAARGEDAPQDRERDRRLGPREERRIIGVLQQQLARAPTLELRARAEGLQLMFELALQTAMRMREMYTLARDQIHVQRTTIHLTRTKNGDYRQVPLNDEACAILRRSWPALEGFCKEGRLLPFWNGQLTHEVLKSTTAELSRMFADVFQGAGSRDLHFHDTRHEAVCRWVLNTDITSEQLGRAAGMRDARTRGRYLSLRGSEIAAVLNTRRPVGESARTTVDR
jgi:integrase